MQICSRNWFYIAVPAEMRRWIVSKQENEVVVGQCPDISIWLINELRYVNTAHHAYTYLGNMILFCWVFPENNKLTLLPPSLLKQFKDILVTNHTVISLRAKESRYTNGDRKAFHSWWDWWGCVVLALFPVEPLWQERGICCSFMQICINTLFMAAWQWLKSDPHVTH